MVRSRWMEPVLLSSCLLIACTDRAIVVDTAIDAETDGVEDDDEPVDDDGEPPPVDDDEPNDDDDDECGDLVVSGAIEFPARFSGILSPGNGQFQPSCVSVVSNDTTIRFTAPSAGTYTFDTRGSSFDTVLSAYGESCEAPELACNDDSGADLSSSIGLSMDAGETVVVVIDGFGQLGTWMLEIDETSQCPQDELGSELPVFFEGRLEGNESDSAVPSCAGAGPDRSFIWTPPITGRVQLSTAGSDFDTVLALFNAQCAAEQACNDDALGGVFSRIEADVVANVPIVIVVEGFSGSSTGTFELSITEL